MSKTTIAISMGDPAGIGPEVIIALLPVIPMDAKVILAGELRYIERSMKSMGDMGGKNAAGILSDFGIEIVEVKTPGEAPVGKPTRESGEASIKYVEAALDIVMSGKADALITAPISKSAIKLAGYNYPGHTELLGEKTESEPVMMLGVGPLKISLVTTHIALREVPGAITRRGVKRACRVTHDALKLYGGNDAPRIAVMGLNPHASDGGIFGDEEAKIIEPVIKSMQEEGMAITGPLSPDTVPYRLQKGEFDAAVAMYHDQAALPVKTMGFENGVNITLGLPIIRTSPDHGTAYDIAGKNTANASSMMEAINLAIGMARMKESRK